MRIFQRKEMKANKQRREEKRGEEERREGRRRIYRGPINIERNSVCYNQNDRN
jgi:hypothetical protein